MAKKNSKIGFSVLDVFLLLLAVVCVFSFVFSSQIRGFLSRDEGVNIEYTFLIQNVSDQARNRPEEGEELFHSKDMSSLGKLTQINEAEKEYHGVGDKEDVLLIKNLTCKAEATARQTDRGYELGSFVIKPGAELSVETENASFTMVITMVRSVDE